MMKRWTTKNKLRVLSKENENINVSVPQFTEHIKYFPAWLENGRQVSIVPFMYNILKLIKTSNGKILNGDRNV